ncbi:MAG: cytochrome c biogenesis protein CcsA [Ignavibacteriaceae bacterium]|jgi:heme exporter protein C|nr:MAG: hypothetical protein EDM69_08755 [Chlorobiota bacterium]KXK01820.1 MAG: ABC-type cytochrome c biogenesis transport system permease component C [Chlorobi bacterium OLB4]MBV6399333.1 Heme exporter protein C [Ignavibacteria bacterium]MCC6886777.1 cytochrome c biogenesis protein CcsA [Ignavibacteriales bacterium]MCE7953714.1 hypothetical protein [Chlorobi bacterium CHB7]MDL1887649.1 hypothetical protein [Ignavibacteria bacterium CHB1]MEB2329870.1 cytochrome c biogenesis protein CcsA [Igna
MRLAFQILVFVLISSVLVAGFSVPIPFIPALGEKARILYFHVPTAWVSVVAFFMSMLYSIKYLRSGDPVTDLKSFSANSLGFLFCLLATLTGALWAKFSWGAFWNWDPRQTSIFILLLIYGAYFSLRSAINDERKKARLSSVYSIIAFVTVPFFVFVVPRIVETLHPDPIVNTEGKLKMDSVMFVIFIVSLLSFTLLYFWMFDLKLRLEKLKLKEK